MLRDHLEKVHQHLGDAQAAVLGRNGDRRDVPVERHLLCGRTPFRRDAPFGLAEHVAHHPVRMRGYRGERHVRPLRQVV